MIIFHGNIEADEKEYSKVAAKGKEIIKHLELVFQDDHCPEHPFHRINVRLNFTTNLSMEIEVTNSCCEKFMELFHKKINEAT